MRKIQVGLLGLGTVGMGVYKLLRKRAETMDKTIGAQLEIKRFLSIIRIRKEKESMRRFLQMIGKKL